MRRYESEGVHIAHDAQRGLTSIRFEPGADLSEASAVAVLAHLATILDLSDAPLLLVGDARNTQHVTLMWQLRWAEFLRRHRERVYISIHGAPAASRVIAESVAFTTRAHIHFATDAMDAERWLLRQRARRTIA